MKHLRTENDTGVTLMPREPTEHTFSRSATNVIRKRVFLPPELQKEVHEERFIIEKKEELNNWINNYTYREGWTRCWIDLPAVVKGAEAVEVILRRHKKLGQFILFKVYKPRDEKV